MHLTPLVTPADMIALLPIIMMAANYGVDAAETKTKDLFIDNMDPNAAWAASVVAACSGSTTYAVVCTSAPFNGACSTGALPMTITQGSSVYTATTPAISYGTSVNISETCAFDHTASSASCIQTIEARNYGRENIVTTAFNLTAEYYHKYQVAITAGAEKLDNDQCSTNQNSGASIQLSATQCATILAVMAMGVIAVL